MVATVANKRHTHDSQDQILALAFRQKSLTPLKLSLLRSPAGVAKSRAQVSTFPENEEEGGVLPSTKHVFLLLLYDSQACVE